MDETDNKVWYENGKTLRVLLAVLVVILIFFIMLYARCESEKKVHGCPEDMDMKYLQNAVLEISVGNYSSDEKKERFASLMYCIVKDALKGVDINDEQSINAAIAEMGLTEENLN